MIMLIIVSASVVSCWVVARSVRRMNSWPFQPILFDEDGGLTGLILCFVFMMFTGLVGFVAFVFYLLKGRHAKDNWKRKLDVEDDDEEQERRGRGVRVTSLKRKDREASTTETAPADEEAATG